MVLTWVYRRLAESHLNKPPFCDDKNKNNGSENCPKLENLDSLKLPVDVTNESKEKPIFKKKSVYYFSPNYFLKKDEASKMDSLYQFYLKTLKEKESNDTKSVNATNENEYIRCNSSPDKTKDNTKEDLMTEKYATDYASSNRETVIDFTNNSSSTILKQVFNNIHNYLIFPFQAMKMIFDFDNSKTTYYCARFHDKSDSNAKSSDEDIYSIDDLTYEKICLQEKEENIEKPSCNLLETEIVNEDNKINENCDQQYIYLEPEIYKPSEIEENTNTPNQCKSKGNETEICFAEKYFKNKQTDKGNHSNAIPGKRLF